MNGLQAAIEVRRMHPGDAQLACAAVNVIRLEGEGESHRVSMQYISEFLQNENNWLIVASQDGVPLGYVLGYCLPRFDMDRGMLYIHDVSVISNRRREGIGKMLFEKTVHICREKRLVKMFLGTGKNNLPAVRLYTSVGGQCSPESDPPEGFNWRFEYK